MRGFVSHLRRGGVPIAAFVVLAATTLPADEASRRADRQNFLVIVRRLDASR